MKCDGVWNQQCEILSKLGWVRLSQVFFFGPLRSVSRNILFVLTHVFETCFLHLDPILIDVSLFIGCFVETRNYSILSRAFIACSLRVTEENLVFETVQSGPYSSFECFLCS